MNRAQWEKWSGEITACQRDFRSRHSIDWDVHVCRPFPGQKDTLPRCEINAGGLSICGPLESVRVRIRHINEALAEVERLNSLPLEGDGHVG